jgi:hypothetical protein
MNRHSSCRAINSPCRDRTLGGRICRLAYRRIFAGRLVTWDCPRKHLRRQNSRTGAETCYGDNPITSGHPTELRKRNDSAWYFCIAGTGPLALDLLDRHRKGAVNTTPSVRESAEECAGAPS